MVVVVEFDVVVELVVVDWVVDCDAVVLVEFEVDVVCVEVLFETIMVDDV